MRAGRSTPRLALSREEAAEALGIGLTTFKEQVQPHLRIVRRGKVRMIPVAELERWLDANAERVLDGVESPQLDAPARQTPPGAGAGPSFRGPGAG